MAPRARRGYPFVSGALAGDVATFRGVINSLLFASFSVITVALRFVLRAVVSRHLFSFVSGVGSLDGGFVLLN